MTIITEKEAEKKGMRAITTAMAPTDPLLFQVFQDFKTVARTEWSLVRDAKNLVSIWRIPMPSAEYGGNGPSRWILGADRPA